MFTRRFVQWKEKKHGADGDTTRGRYLQAAAGAVLRYDTDVGRVDARPDEPGEVVELNVSHLKITTQTLSDCESPQTRRTPWKQRTDGSFMHRRFRVTRPALRPNSLFAVGFARTVIFHLLSGIPAQLTHVHVMPELPLEIMNGPVYWGGYIQ